MSSEASPVTSGAPSSLQPGAPTHRPAPARLSGSRTNARAGVMPGEALGAVLVSHPHDCIASEASVRERIAEIEAILQDPELSNEVAQSRVAAACARDRAALCRGLTEMIRREEDPGVKADLLNNLVLFAGHECLDLLRELSAAGDESLIHCQLRSDAVEIASRISDPQAAQLVLDCVERSLSARDAAEHDAVQTAARYVRSAAQSGGSALAARLDGYLHDPVFSPLRAEVLLALGAIRDPESAERLARFYLEARKRSASEAGLLEAQREEAVALAALVESLASGWGARVVEDVIRADRASGERVVMALVQRERGDERALLREVMRGGSFGDDARFALTRGLAIRGDAEAVAALLSIVTDAGGQSLPMARAADAALALAFSATSDEEQLRRAESMLHASTSPSMRVRIGSHILRSTSRTRVDGFGFISDADWLVEESARAIETSGMPDARIGAEVLARLAARESSLAVSSVRRLLDSGSGKMEAARRGHVQVLLDGMQAVIDSGELTPPAELWRPLVQLACQSRHAGIGVAAVRVLAAALPDIDRHTCVLEFLESAAEAAVIEAINQWSARSRRPTLVSELELVMGRDSRERVQEAAKAGLQRLKERAAESGRWSGGWAK